MTYIYVTHFDFAAANTYKLHSVSIEVDTSKLADHIKIRWSLAHVTWPVVWEHDVHQSFLAADITSSFPTIESLFILDGMQQVISQGKRL